MGLVFRKRHFAEGPEVTDEMVVTAQRGGLPPDLERRVLERAYFLFLNGVSDDQCRRGKHKFLRNCPSRP